MISTNPNQIQTDRFRRTVTTQEYTTRYKQMEESLEFREPNGNRPK